jgi:hypothetical protein
MPDRASPRNPNSITGPQHCKPGPAFRDKPSPAQEGNAGAGLTTEQDLDHQTATSQARSGVPRQAFPSAGGECRIGPHHRTRPRPPDRSIASPFRRSATSLSQRRRGMPDRASPPNSNSTTRPQHRKPGPPLREKPSPAPVSNGGSSPRPNPECRNRSRASAQIASDHSHSIVAGGFPEMS